MRVIAGGLGRPAYSGGLSGSIQISPQSMILGPGQQVVVQATYIDAAGGVIPSVAVWSSTNSAVASVGPDSGTPAHQAVVTGQAVGLANVNVTLT